jgi:hypothetical protein
MVSSVVIVIAIFRAIHIAKVYVDLQLKLIYEGKK